MRVTPGFPACWSTNFGLRLWSDKKAEAPQHKQYFRQTFLHLFLLAIQSAGSTGTLIGAISYP